MTTKITTTIINYNKWYYFVAVGIDIVSGVVAGVIVAAVSCVICCQSGYVVCKIFAYVAKIQMPHNVNQKGYPLLTCNTHTHTTHTHTPTTTHIWTYTYTCTHWLQQTDTNTLTCLPWKKKKNNNFSHVQLWHQNFFFIF